jgi:hypothetical protein
MARMIKVNIFGRNGVESRLLSPDEAEAVLNAAYDDPLGGLVTDAVTGAIISCISPETEEINISEIMGIG